MSMKTYNEDFVPGMCGLVNTGSICYLNSMLQALMSCSAFNEHLLENRRAYEAAAVDGNTIGIQIIKLLEENGLGGKKEFTIGRSSCKNILQALISQRRRQNSISNLSQYQQEGLHEGLVFLLEALIDADKSISELFSIRHRMVIKCQGCGVANDGPRAAPEYVINLFEVDPIIQDNLDTKEAIESYIKQHAHNPDDYRCEKCGIQNLQDDKGVVSKNVLQVYSLARISSIVILLFNKYHHRDVKFFPQSLDFKAKSGNLHYEVMAQIEHYGKYMQGGHYLSKCRRPKPRDFGKFMASKQLETTTSSISRLKKKKTSLKRRLKAEREKTSRLQRKITDFTKQIDICKKTIEKLESRLENLTTGDPLLGEDHAVFHINDSQVGIDPNGFVPSPNTFMVLYQLV